MSVNCNVCGCDFYGPHVMDMSGEAMHPTQTDCVDALRAALADERKHADALAVELSGALGACDDDLGWEYTQNCYDDAGRLLLEEHAARRKEQANG